MRFSTGLTLIVHGPAVEATGPVEAEEKVWDWLEGEDVLADLLRNPLCYEVQTVEVFESDE